jgi:hypothetical protein
MANIKNLDNNRSRKGVQNFADFAGDPTHVRFDEMIDQVIYIVKIEPQTSEKFGSGFKVWFKDLPNAAATQDAAVYGQYVVPQLENLYNLTNKGNRISLDSPIKTTIRQAGRTYRFE